MEVTLIIPSQYCPVISNPENLRVQSKSKYNQILITVVVSNTKIDIHTIPLWVIDARLSVMQRDRELRRNNDVAPIPLEMVR
jgi:hypothetical protein